MKTHQVAGILLVLALILSGCGSVAAFVEDTATTAPLTAVETETADPTEEVTTASATTEVTDTPTSSPTETPMSTPTDTPQPVAPTATEETTTEAETFPADDAPSDPTATYPPPPASVNVPILMYHYVSELPPNPDVYRQDLTVTPAQFESHLQYLSGAGYQTVTLDDVYARLATGKPLPPRPIVLTFDDGYKDAYTNAVPLLQKYGFIGEFFILATPAHYEAAQYLSWNDMKAMADAGMSIQAHGRDHYDLTNRDYDFLVYQILGAREAVEAHTGQSVSFFCYPSGRHDADTEAVVASAGYLGAVTTAWGNELRLDNAYAWPRIRIKGAWDQAYFADILESLPQSN